MVTDGACGRWLPCAVVERVLLAVATAATLIGAAIWNLGQSVLDPSAELIERILSAGGIITAAWLVVRWSLRLISEIRETARLDREGALEREALLVKQLELTVGQLAETQGQLAAERTLRISLEHAGLPQRRENGLEREPTGRPSDAEPDPYE